MFDNDLCLQIQGDVSYQKSIQKLLDAMDSYIPTPIPKADQTFMMPVQDVFQSKATTQIKRLQKINWDTNFFAYKIKTDYFMTKQVV